MFAHRLALALSMTVEDLLGRMSADEFLDWAEYYRLEPFGERVADLRSGIVAAILRNAHKAKDDQRIYKPQDFLLSFNTHDEDDGAASEPPPPPDVRAQFMRFFPPQ